MPASVLQDARVISFDLHTIDGEVVVVDGRPPPDELDAHRGGPAVEVFGLDLARPTPAAHNEPAVNMQKWS